MYSKEPRFSTANSMSHSRKGSIDLKARNFQSTDRERNIGWRIRGRNWFLTFSVALNILFLIWYRTYGSYQYADRTARRLDCPAPLPTIFSKSPPDSGDTEIKLAARSFHQLVRRLFKEREIDSLAISVVTSNGPIYETFKGPVRANESTWQSSRTVDRHSIYRIASVSKLIASLETLILRDRGVLNLDDPISKYVPQIDLQPSEHSPHGVPLGQITVRQLMSHMSGLGFSYRRTAIPGKALNTTGFLEELSNQPTVATPYSLPTYSSAGFALLGIILSTAARSSASQGDDSPCAYEELVRNDIFAKIGMNGSSFSVDDSNRWDVVVPSTNSKTVDYDYSMGNPSGGQMASLSDLSKLARNLLTPPSQEGNSLLSTATLQEWLKPLFNYWDGVTSVGMPWEITRTKLAFGRSTDIFSKGGVFTSQYSTFTLVPSHSFAVIILSAAKENPVPELQRLAMEYFLPAFDNALTRATSDHLAGCWRSEDGRSVIEITVSGGQLFALKFLIDGVESFAHTSMESNGTEAMKPVPIWSMGKSEFRLIPASDPLNAVPCFSQWVLIDAKEYANGKPSNLFRLLQHENDTSKNRLFLPSSGQLLHRSI